MVISDSFVENVFSEYSGKQWEKDPIKNHTVYREENILKKLKLHFFLKYEHVEIDISP